MLKLNGQDESSVKLHRMPQESYVLFFHRGHKSPFFYRAISLAPVKLGITCNAEVTQNGPRANAKISLHISLVATLRQPRDFLSQACLSV